MNGSRSRLAFQLLGPFEEPLDVFLNGHELSFRQVSIRCSNAFGQWRISDESLPVQMVRRWIG